MSRSSGNREFFLGTPQKWVDVDLDMSNAVYHSGEEKLDREMWTGAPSVTPEAWEGQPLFSRQKGHILNSNLQWISKMDSNYHSCTSYAFILQHKA